jgi:hypothetical protein
MPQDQRMDVSTIGFSRLQIRGVHCSLQQQAGD